jgi:hypothetical protein
MKREQRALFRSFWLASFAAADHLPGMRLGGRDTFDPAEYRARVDADYAIVRDAGIECVRESVGWRRIGSTALDFSTVVLREECAKRHGLQIVWTLCRDGWPEGVDVCSEAFVDALRELARKAARVLAPYRGPEGHVYTPVNEISFLAWALAETGLVCAPRADLRNRSYELKQQLVRAALAACDAILEVDPDARFLHSEPATSAIATAHGEARHDAQFRAFDMLCGRLEPQLGGHPRYVDAIAIHCHRGAHPWRGTPEAATGRARPPAPTALSRLLEDVYARYGTPIVVDENGPSPAGRAAWLREIGDEVGIALEQSVPVVALCLSRVVERPGWEDPRYWRGRRLWDVLLHASHHAPRVRDSAYEQALRDLRSRIDPLVASQPSRYSS